MAIRRDKRGRFRKAYGRGMKPVDRYFYELYHSDSIAAGDVAGTILLSHGRNLYLTNETTLRRFQEILFGKEKPMACKGKKRPPKK